MRWLSTAAAVLAATMAAGSVHASSCVDAERGTYLSNVCFLVEEFTHRKLFSALIASVNEVDCTVTLAEPYLGLAGNTIYFNRAERRLTQIYHHDHRTTCWRLEGEGVSGEGTLSNVAAVCGNRTGIRRLRRAFANLHDEYCPARGKESEF